MSMYSDSDIMQERKFFSQLEKNTEWGKWNKYDM